MYDWLTLAGIGIVLPDACVVIPTGDELLLEKQETTNLRILCVE